MIRLPLLALSLALSLLLQGCAHKQLFNAAQSYATASSAVLPRVNEARVLAASVEASLPETVSEVAIDSQVVEEGCKRAVGPQPSSDSVLLGTYAKSLTTLSTAPDDSFAALIASLKSELPRAADVHESAAALAAAHAHEMQVCRRTRRPGIAAEIQGVAERSARHVVRRRRSGRIREEGVRSAEEADRRRGHGTACEAPAAAGERDAAVGGSRGRASPCPGRSRSGRRDGRWSVGSAEQQRATATSGPLRWSGNAEAAQALRDFGLAYRLRNALLVESDGVPGALVSLEGLQGKLIEAAQKDRRLSFDDLKAIRTFVEDVRKKVSEL